MEEGKGLDAIALRDERLKIEKKLMNGGGGRIFVEEVQEVEVEAPVLT